VFVFLFSDLILDKEALGVAFTVIVSAWKTGGRQMRKQGTTYNSTPPIDKT
jgi:hypothetical protein